MQWKHGRHRALKLCLFLLPLLAAAGVSTDASATLSQTMRYFQIAGTNNCLRLYPVAISGTYLWETAPCNPAGDVNQRVEAMTYGGDTANQIQVWHLLDGSQGCMNHTSLNQFNLAGTDPDCESVPNSQIGYDWGVMLDTASACVTLTPYILPDSAQAVGFDSNACRNGSALNLVPIGFPSEIVTGLTSSGEPFVWEDDNLTGAYPALPGIFLNGTYQPNAAGQWWQVYGTTNAGGSVLLSTNALGSYASNSFAMQAQTDNLILPVTANPSDLRQQFYFKRTVNGASSIGYSENRQQDLCAGPNSGSIKTLPCNFPNAPAGYILFGNSM